MGGLSWIHWLIVIVLVMVLFGGRGKISELMGDVAKGIKSFRKGMAEEPPPANSPANGAANGDRPQVTIDGKSEPLRQNQDQHKV